MNKFIPKMYKKDIYSINYELLKKKNIKLIAFDLDNTIGLINQEKPNMEAIRLVKKIQKDFDILIVSNNFKKRVEKFTKDFGCDYYSFALKPLKFTKRFIHKKYHYNMNEVSLVGDQLVTDIFGANRAGMYSILVDPISDKDLKITSLNRFLEKRIIKKIKFKKGEYYEED